MHGYAAFVPQTTGLACTWPFLAAFVSFRLQNCVLSWKQKEAEEAAAKEEEKKNKEKRAKMVLEVILLSLFLSLSLSRQCISTLCRILERSGCA